MHFCVGEAETAIMFFS